MKERINISIEYSLISEIKELGYIHNLSRYLEKCLRKSLDYYKKVNNIQKNNPQNSNIEEEIKKILEEIGDD